jgi:gas vesicle protein
MTTGVIVAAIAALALAGSACTNSGAADAKKDAGAALDATKSGADKVLVATKKAGQETADVTKDVAKKTADQTEEFVSDSWITTKLKAKFADEKMLEGSEINVDTTDHVVRLRGTVLSQSAKARAAEIARGTERVTRVVDELSVK